LSSKAAPNRRPFKSLFVPRRMSVSCCEDRDEGSSQYHRKLEGPVTDGCEVEVLLPRADATKRLGVATQYLRNLDRAGRLRAPRTDGGHRRIPLSEVHRLMGEPEQRPPILYARVSSLGQKDDLERPKERLQRAFPGAETHTDIRSGLKVDRPGFLAVLKAVQERRVSRVMVTDEDRLARVGADRLRQVFAACGTTLEVLDGTPNASPESELANDLIAIIPSFSARLYGLRSRKAKRLRSEARTVVKDPDRPARLSHGAGCHQRPADGLPPARRVRRLRLQRWPPAEGGDLPVQSVAAPAVKTPTAIDLRRELNLRKKADLGWMHGSSKCAPQEALRDRGRAFRNFFEGRARYPRFHSRHSGRSSFRLTGTVKVENGHLTPPRVGRVRLKERGYLPPTAHLRSATVSERAGRWCVSLSVEEERRSAIPSMGEAVGVDLGIHVLATVSDGTVVPNPRALMARLRKLQHLQRAVSRKRKGSHNREKAKRRSSRCHAKVADLRKDTLHQATTMLARANPVVAVEDRRPKNLLRSHALARSLSDASFGEFVRQLEYKCRWYGSRLVKADPFYPSTQRCSSCGNVKAEMPLSERTDSCPSCGLVMDRDRNARRNLAMVAASSAETVNARGGRRFMPETAGAAQGIRNLTEVGP
jgi:putative transposase